MVKLSSIVVTLCFTAILALPFNEYQGGEKISSPSLTMEDVSAKTSVTPILDDLKKEREHQLIVESMISKNKKAEVAHKISREKKKPKVVATTVSRSQAKKPIPKPQPQPKPQPALTGQTIQVVATAYTARCKGCSGITATGIDVRNSTPNIIAVDPRVIPLGSKVEINGEIYIAGDKGGAIKGNKIDILMATHQEAINWGRRTISIKILK